MTTLETLKRVKRELDTEQTKFWILDPKIYRASVHELVSRVTSELAAIIEKEKDNETSQP